MFRSFNKDSIATKVYATIFGSILSLIIVSGFAVQQMANIGEEITSIAKIDLPLTMLITEASTNQLEQTIQFERFLKFALETQTDSSAVADYDKAVAAFQEHGRLVQQKIIEAERLSETSIETTTIPAQRAELQKVLANLKSIELEHVAFEDHVGEVIALVAAGEITEGVKLGDQIDAEVDKLDHEIETLLLEIESFTSKAALLAEEHEKSALFWLIVLSVVVITTVSTSGYYIVTNIIIRPLETIARSVEQLSNGQLNNKVQVSNSDEIGLVAGGLEMFRVGMIEAEELRKKSAEQEKQIVERAERIAKINREFDTDVSGVLSSVASAVGQMNESAHSVATASGQTKSQAKVIRTKADESDRNMQTIGAATNELSSSVDEIGHQINTATDVSRNAVSNAQSAQDQVKDLVASGQKIGEVINLISDIAEQTNLLALNATIEAARAGEAGKGFAVVASEVKSLATQTAKATQEIGEQIEGMQNVTNITASEIEKISSTIQGVDDVITAIAGAMEEQSATIQEINRNIQFASDGAQEINDNADQVNAAANGTGDCAEVLLGASQDLSKSSDDLRDKISAFLTQIRAA